MKNPLNIRRKPGGWAAKRFERGYWAITIMDVVTDPVSSVGPLPRPDVPRGLARAPAPSPGKTPMRLLSRLIAAALLAFVFAPPAPAQDAPPVDGLIVTVPLKITEAGVQQHIKGPIDAARNDRTRNIK